jgi:predicted nucleic acid-binding Zn finger protein
VRLLFANIISKGFGDIKGSLAKIGKADEVVKAGRVKRHVFKPSGREIWTVVGSKVDHYIDLEQPYCSCKDFYYNLIRGLEQTCYHIEAARIAKQARTYCETTFSDEEYQHLLKAILEDLAAKRKRYRA